MSCRFFSCFMILAAAALAQDGVPDFVVSHPECLLFGPKYNEFVSKAINLNNLTTHRAAVGALTRDVAARLAFVPPDSRTYTFAHPSEPGTVDFYIFGALQAAGVTPAPATTDYEFIRRVTLDLTG